MEETLLVSTSILVYQLTSREFLIQSKENSRGFQGDLCCFLQHCPLSTRFWRCNIFALFGLNKRYIGVFDVFEMDIGYIWSSMNIIAFVSTVDHSVERQAHFLDFVRLVTMEQFWGIFLFESSKYSSHRSCYCVCRWFLLSNLRRSPSRFCR